ncbi:MAG: MOSC domain-containing protein [Parvularculaceae bacterium]
MSKARRIGALRIAALRLHPLKGGRGLEVEAARVEVLGLCGDRRWLATDADGRFLTQRDCPGLARVDADYPDANDVSRLRLAAEGAGEIVATGDGPQAEVNIWRDVAVARAAGADADAWLASVLGRPARLWFMADETARTTEEGFCAPGPVSFADAYPVLVVNTGSLAALNDALDAPVAMARFRPNIVVEGAAPWAEDAWRTLTTGDGVELELVKPCRRCEVTTLDPATGENLGEEPLRALSRVRKSGDPAVKGFLFGWNAIVRAGGLLRVGDAVEVAAAKTPWPIAGDA